MKKIPLFVKLIAVMILIAFSFHFWWFFPSFSIPVVMWGSFYISKMSSLSLALKKWLYFFGIIWMISMYVVLSSHDENKIVETKKYSSVMNSAYDGSVWQAQSFIKRQLKDPDSFQSINWSPVVETKTGYSVSVKFRAKNSFNGFVINNWGIDMNQDGAVISIFDIDKNEIIYP